MWPRCGRQRAAGNRVRIIVQLIDAQNDAYLWSETYDRELKDIFSVESEVAQNIAGALKSETDAGGRAVVRTGQRAMQKHTISI